MEPNLNPARSVPLAARAWMAASRATMRTAYCVLVLPELPFVLLLGELLELLPDEPLG